jgi:hypothetical protein
MQLPVSIVYLRDFLPIQNNRRMQLIDAFVADIESTYGVEAQKVSIAEKWGLDTPAEAKESSIEEYLKDVCINCLYGD